MFVISFKIILIRHEAQFIRTNAITPKLVIGHALEDDEVADRFMTSHLDSNSKIV